MSTFAETLIRLIRLSFLCVYRVSGVDRIDLIMNGSVVERLVVLCDLGSIPSQGKRMNVTLLYHDIHMVL